MCNKATDTVETLQSIAFQPPPPPPPQPALPNIVKNPTVTNAEFNSKAVLSEATWARNDLELQKACFFGRVCLHNLPKKYKYHKEISGILQNGPTCGLTAVSMLLHGRLTAAELLTIARDRGFTNNGEMFSAKNLHELFVWAVNNIKNDDCEPSEYNSRLWRGSLDCDEIKHILENDALLLVPYDSDVNHAPTQLCGHKAHWALIVGYLIDENDKFYVLARHGKSRNLSAWSLKDLSDSNLNLNEFKQPKEHPHDVFLLPDGGISGFLGLKGISIVVEIINK